jgi:hypothetical protein
MPPVNQRMRWLLWLYILTSMALSTAPIWIREIIVARYSQYDMTTSSLGDGIGWFMYVLYATIGNALIQILAICLPGLGSLATRALLILSSILLWVASIWWVHHIGVP